MATTSPMLFTVKLLAALGCGLIAGVFFAFSSFVMPALAQRPPAEGMAAMQSINITVINPLFMTAFLGTAVMCLILAIAALSQGPQPGRAYLLWGSLLYLVGTVGVTIAGNVPMNEALAIADPGSLEGPRLWANYLTQWTVWNHLRTATALAAAALFTLAIAARAA